MTRTYGPCGEITLEGGGASPKLAANLTYPSSLTNATGLIIVPGIDASGSLTPVLSLTGKFIINNLTLSGIKQETGTIKLTVDGDPVWNDTYTLQNTLHLIGSKSGSSGSPSRYMCDSSFLLEVQTLTDTDIQLEYNASPIL